MNRHLTAPHRHRRALASLWFVMIGLPLAIFGAGISFDLTQVIATQRQVSTAAQAAANAGALQIDPATGRIDTGPASDNCLGAPPSAPPHTFARETFNVALTNGLDRWLTNPRLTSNISADCLDISVTVEYTNTNLVFLPIVSALAGDGTRDIELGVTRTASVCDPNIPDGPTGGECDRPLRFR